MVMVQNNSTRAVPTKANVGPITIQLRPIICETVFQFKPPLNNSTTFVIICASFNT